MALREATRGMNTTLVVLQDRFCACVARVAPSPSVPLCLCGESQRASHHQASPLARGALAASTLVRIHHRDTEAQRGTEILFQPSPPCFSLVGTPPWLRMTVLLPFSFAILPARCACS